MARERGLCEVQMPDVVLRGILRASRIEDFPHLMLDLHRIEPFFHEIVLVHDMTEEVAVIEFVEKF